jgi:uncharacterized membrane protein HdeD (DUF308 family)
MVEPSPKTNEIEQKVDGKTLGYCLVLSGILMISTAFSTNLKVLVGILLCVAGIKLMRHKPNGDKK